MNVHFSQIPAAVRIDLRSRLRDAHLDRAECRADRRRRTIELASSDRLLFDVGPEYRFIRNGSHSAGGVVKPNQKTWYRCA